MFQMAVVAILLAGSALLGTSLHVKDMANNFMIDNN